MEAETCTASHAGIPTSDVRCGADFKNYYASDHCSNIYFKPG